MKVAAAHAIASLAKLPVPESLCKAYGVDSLTFGRDYILPKPFDKRLLCTVAPAIARAAVESGVAREPVGDYDAYIRHLSTLIEDNDAYITRLLDRDAEFRIGNK